MGNDRAAMRGTNVKGAGGGGGAQFTGHDKLTDAQKEAVLAYQEWANGRINGFLRGAPGNTGGLGDDHKRIMKDLDRITARGRINQPTTLYRGWTLEQGTSGLPANLFVGMTMTDPGFLSTSTSRKVADSFAGSFNGVVMRVRAPAGTRGLYVQGAGVSQKYTQGEKAEHEVLLPRGMKYKIKAAKRRADGVLVLDADLVP